jgi:hypothetical protein
VEFVGDVLPKVIEAHADDAAWMGRLPTLEERGAVSGFGLARRAVA